MYVRKPVISVILAGAFSLFGVSAAVYAEKHAKEATEHLDQAVESGKKGDAEGAAKHTEEAQQHAIEENKEHPYAQPSKAVTGENPKAEHDTKAFSEIKKAKGHAKKDHAKEAGEAADKAATHLEEKKQAE
ncbi:small metal-binding protein SmbP [Methylocaldum sp.]|uniref:small metal-binding protein SmbP n=1 Tax=Methylocaldum sp. TaxID=1969727 RepID=UPI002D234C85|nr:small metal-binding protein SmbP [Methylocaldum sp.]HYE36930.1 small metal-binding protein SmbP [Methylocaldum sp.]